MGTRNWQIMRKLLWLLGLVLVGCLVTSFQNDLVAQPQNNDQNQEDFLFNEGIFHAMHWRNIGPFRGGRSNCVSGIPGDPLTYFMGTVGGGVWKTADAGISWINISDGYFQSSSIGAIAIAPSNPNIIYVGTGEHAVRGVMSSPGDGLYRSDDGGQSWTHIGLAKTQHISKILVDPRHPEHLWVAAQGATFGKSRHRGVFKSEDGGQNWTHVLYANETSGAADLSINPENPRIMIATLWDHQRTAWSIRSGGPGSGIYRSTDGGNNWEKLSSGLPTEIGKAGVAYSPANPNVIYANIEAKQGGVYQSEDGGDSWTYLSNDPRTTGRAWYYSKIVASPHNEQAFYVLNAPLLYSADGGNSFVSIDNPHTDQHDLWINPDNPKNMILANDGGATITFNGGLSWSTQINQSTAQLYRIAADNQEPYNLYAAQQDNTSFKIPSRTFKQGIGPNDLSVINFGESGFISPHPANDRYIFGTNYLGNIGMFDQQTGALHDIMAYPISNLGKQAVDHKYRFNWNAPMLHNPLEADLIYHGANHLLKSRDNGLSWQEISPDLTRDDRNKQGLGGYPFTNEGAGAEVYNTISYISCSKFNKNEIWVGTDDGLLHLTHDAGKTWDNITPPSLPEAYINVVEVSPHQAGTAFIVAYRYKFNDFQSYVYKTSDYGNHWEKITKGLSQENFARVLRQDPANPAILYLGTENGLYISFNQGANWHPFQLDLPICSITDVLIKNQDLIVATAGRGIWILDNIAPIQQSGGIIEEEKLHLFKPSLGIRHHSEEPQFSDTYLGENPSCGISLDYHLPESNIDAPLILSIYNEKDQLVRHYRSEEDSLQQKSFEFGPLLPKLRGVNRFYWNLRGTSLPGIIGQQTTGDYRGSIVPPGVYTIKLSNGEDFSEQQVVIKPDPRLALEWKDYQQQAALLAEIEGQLRDIHDAVNKVQVVQNQISILVDFLEKSEEHKDLVEKGTTAISKIETWKAKIVQNKWQSTQDFINFPGKINADFLDLKQRLDKTFPIITEGIQKRLVDLKIEWETHKSTIKGILESDVTEFNKIFKEKNIPALVLPSVNAF